MIFVLFDEFMIYLFNEQIFNMIMFVEEIFQWIEFRRFSIEFINGFLFIFFLEDYRSVHSQFSLQEFIRSWKDVSFIERHRRQDQVFNQIILNHHFNKDQNLQSMHFSGMMIFLLIDHLERSKERIHILQIYSFSSIEWSHRCLYEHVPILLWSNNDCLCLPMRIDQPNRRRTSRENKTKTRSNMSLSQAFFFFLFFIYLPTIQYKSLSLTSNISSNIHLKTSLTNRFSISLDQSPFLSLNIPSHKPFHLSFIRTKTRHIYIRLDNKWVLYWVLPSTITANVK